MTGMVEVIAPAATMIAAMMTAANVSVRLTGWGFVVFTLGSVCWSILGATTGQTGLLISNVFLTGVNAVGVYRWLGRQAKFTDGSTRAIDSSKRHAGPTLLSAAGLLSAPVEGADGATLGTVVDAMLSSDDNSIQYLVVSCGGLAGLGETLHALCAADLNFEAGVIRTKLTTDQVNGLPAIQPDHWPSQVPRPA